MLRTLLFFIVISNLGCSSQKSDDSNPVLDLPDIVKRGYISVSMDNNSTGYFIYRGKPMGYEYELMRRFAADHNLQLRVDVNRDLEKAFDKLVKGKTDILAYDLTITKQRKKRIDFTHHHNLIKQVLIQKKPKGWRKMHPKKIDRLLVRNPVDLIGREVHVRNHSAHEARLKNLSEELGDDIKIVLADTDEDTENLIKMVSEGTIDFTVAEEDVALVNARYYPNIDVKTAISLPQRISWGIRKDTPELKKSLNEWLKKIKSGPIFATIYNRYFRKRKKHLHPENDFFSISDVSSGKISPYDNLIKDAAKELGWDWRLLAAQIYKESHFNPKAVSWAGAKGLMQLMPATARAYNVKDLTNPNQSVIAGKKHLIWLQNMWDDVIEDPDERIKFVLASYNVGHGHIFDAISLAEKHGYDGRVWDDVKDFLIKKSQRKYYQDPSVKYGYCRGIEPVTYVTQVFHYFESYKRLVPV